MENDDLASSLRPSDPLEVESFLNSPEYLDARGMIHMSDLHLGCFGIRKRDEEQALSLRIKELQKKKNRTRKIDKLRKREIGIGGLNRRITVLVNAAIAGENLLHVNGDCYELVQSCADLEQVIAESGYFHQELERYYSETGRKVLYTHGNHDEKNLYGPGTDVLRDFLESEGVLIMPKMWVDRMGLCITHGDIPTYRQDVLNKTRSVLEEEDLPHLPPSEQIQRVLEVVDDELPDFLQGTGIKRFCDRLEEFVLNFKIEEARRALEALYARSILPIRRDRKRQLISRRFKEAISTDFVWMDLLNRYTKVVGFVTGHTHQQVLEIIKPQGDREKAGTSYLEMNGGSLMGSITNPPSVLQVDYLKRTAQILEWGKRKKDRVIPGNKWKSRGEIEIPPTCV